MGIFFLISKKYLPFLLETHRFLVVLGYPVEAKNIVNKFINT